MSSHFETYADNLKRTYAAKMLYVYAREQDAQMRLAALGLNPWTGRPFEIPAERRR